MKISSLTISQLAIIISLFSLLISFINVNRQQKASLKNDEERFKRELNLKTSDDFIELLFRIGEFAKKYRAIDRYLGDRNIDGDHESKFDQFNEEFWILTNEWIHLVSDAKSFYLKRKVILKSIANHLIEIELKATELDIQLWAIKDVFGNFEKTQANIAQAQQSAEELTIIVNNTIEEIQNIFLGKLYK